MVLRPLVVSVVEHQQPTPVTTPKVPQVRVVQRSGRGRLVDVQFGGLHQDDVTNENTNILGEESRVITIKDPGFDAGVIEVPNPNAPGNIIVPNAPK